MVPEYEPNDQAREEEKKAIHSAILIIVALLLLGGLAALAIYLVGCASFPSPSDQAAVTAYEAEQLACVAEAGTQLEADRCRCAVHEKYGRPCTMDGGAE